MKIKRLSILLAALCAFTLLSSGWRFREAHNDGNWGLGFGKDGLPPTGNVSSPELAQYDAKYIGDTSKKVLYLTFDAGYEAGHTETILDVLKKHNVPAAFFLVGHYIEQNPQLVQRMASEGHIVANHTYHHPDMPKLTDGDAFKAELESLEKLCLEKTGVQMAKYYRPPQGKYSQKNLEYAKSFGYKTVFWSLAYADWHRDKQPSHEHAFSKLLPRTHNGAVILLHSTSKTNVEIMDELLQKWLDAGYTFGTLDELFE